MSTNKRLESWAAIDYAKKNNLLLCKYEDPIEEAREGLSVEEAEEVASEDPTLIYLDIQTNTGSKNTMTTGL